MTTPNFSLLGFDDHTCTMLTDMHQACTRAEAWDWISSFYEESFMFSEHPKINEISRQMKYTGHSGASFGWCMRNMEAYAKMGTKAYAEKFSKTPDGIQAFIESAKDCECARIGRGVAAGRSYTGGPRNWATSPCSCKATH
jgi:hypothetical protein